MERGSSTAILEQFRTLFELGATGSMTDGQLLDCFGSGGAPASEPAFAALIERHGSMVLGVCRRILDDDHLAEDAFQATFFVLARRGRTIRDRETIGSWLHRVAGRVARRAKVRADRRRRRERPEVGEGVAVSLEDHAEQREIRSIVDAEVDRLGESQRLPIVLCDLQGLTHEEAAQQLRWPIGTVKSRLARGRIRLGERLKRRGLAPSVGLGLGLPMERISTSLVAVTAASAARFASSGGAASVAASSITALARKELLAMTFARWTLAGSVAGLAALGASAAFLVGSLADPTKVALTPSPASAPAVDPEGPTPAATTLSASGLVVDSAGRPVAGASVLVREWATWRTQGLNVEQNAALLRAATIPDILARTQTDLKGRFRLEAVAAPAFPFRPEAGKSEFPWDLVVLAEGQGVAHVQLTAINQKQPITIALPSERPIRGRIVETGGKPIAGATVRVHGVGRIGEDDQHGQKTEGRLNLSWSSIPMVATTDAEGRFTLRGVPPDAQIGLTVRADGHQFDSLYYATTDQPPADVVQTTIRSGQTTQDRTPVRTGDLAIELKPTDHRLDGRLVFEADGKPVAGAQVFRFSKLVGKTDREGRFVIDDLPSGPFELHASSWGSDAAPLALRVEMPEAPKLVERTYVLPRGMTIQGRVTDEATGQGVAEVSLGFDKQLGQGEVWSFFGLSSKTDKDGRYRLVVPGGRGLVQVNGLPPGRPSLPMRGVGQPTEARFSRAVEGANGETVEADFAIPHGRGVVLRTLDGDGRPVKGAEVRLLKDFDSAKVVGRTDPEGRFELVGLDPSKGMTADITHPSRPLGVRVIIPANHEGPALEVKLAPLGSVSSRVLDGSGKPLPGASILLYTDVEFPERVGMPAGDAIADRLGTFRFNRLLEGAEYWVQVKGGGHANATSERFLVKPGEAAKLAEFRLPETNRTLDGFVVDPRGNLLAKVSVSVQPDPSSRYTPSGRFFEETDGQGAFHLDGLPDGELDLLVYRQPEGADRSIRHSTKQKVRAGSKGVRIVLPDPDERLRGIED